jgi:integrase/recombinase XerD
MDWRAAKKGFEAYLRLEKSLSDNSVQAYLRDIEKLSEYFSEDKDKLPLTLKFEDLRDFIRDIAKMGLAPKSQARLISGIKAFYKYLLLEDLIEENPTTFLESPKIGRKLPEVLSHKEIEKMIAAIDLSQAVGTRNKAILETMYSCGLRVSELITLKISDISVNEEIIKVTGKGSKERLVPIGQSALKYISIYINDIRNHQEVKREAEDILFLNNRGRGLSRVMVFYIIKDLADKANIKKNVSPHTFRHSFATVLVDGGADLRAVQQMLGHESITTTEIYTHLDRQYLRDTIEMYHPRGRK